MWLDFTIRYDKKASVQISKADYAQLLKRFSVAGAEQGTGCLFCENVDNDCTKCVLAKALLGTDSSADWDGPCIFLIDGLYEACNAALRISYEEVRHNEEDVRTLRNFRRRIMRAARSE